MKSGSVLFVLPMVLAILSSFAAAAQQGDPVVIRGPAGSEAEDVRVGQERYGPITSSDTLWSIASRVRPHSSVTLPQVMAAIVQANPQAFLDSNPNAMETGYFLRIPSLQEIQMVNPEAARRQMQLGDQLQASNQQVQRNQREAEITAAQRNALLAQTRDEAQQSLQEIRDTYAEEFSDLRQRLARSISNTEQVHAANEELRDRIDSIAVALEQIQSDMVDEGEFRDQLRGLMEAQDELRLQQRAMEEVAQEEGLANRIMANPLALGLLAFVPALLLIIIATLVLRRRAPAVAPVAAGSANHLASHAENATAASMVQNAEDDEDDFELDEAMAEFGDLDDEDDDGDDLSALEDEMLVPDEDDDDSIQLDDDLDGDLDSDNALSLDEFDNLEEDYPQDDEDEVNSGGDTEAADTSKQASADDGSADEFEEGDGELSQSALDDLFAGDDDDDDPFSLSDEDSDEMTDEAGDEAGDEVDSEAEELGGDDEADVVAEENGSGDSDIDDSEEPAPGELFAADDDEPLDLENLGDEDDFDFDKMMEALDDDSLDDEIEDDDIESLLAKSDALVQASEDDKPAAAQVDSASEDEELAPWDSDEELSDERLSDSEEQPDDVNESVELEAEEDLDFDEDKDDGSFRPIDDLMKDADDGDDEDFDADEEDQQSDEARQTDEEDSLAAQLDLARAYLEMEEKEEARQTVEAVIEQSSGDLLDEAKELLARIDS